MSFSAHVLKFCENRKTAVGGKWNDQPLTEQEMKRNFVSNFDNKIKYIKNASQNPQETLGVE